MFVEYFVHVIWETNEHMAWGGGMIHRHTAYYSDINQMTILYILGNLISVIKGADRGLNQPVPLRGLRAYFLGIIISRQIFIA